MYKTFYIFEQRTLPCVFYSIPGKGNFFHEENFVKTKINGYPKVQHLVNMVNESEVSNHAVTIFAWSSKKHVVLDYPSGILCVFFRLITKTSQLSAGLIGSSPSWN